MHEGHRKRMMERLQSGPDSLQDHEILEILLFNALPRVNTNPIAHELIKSFVNLRGVFSASVEQLCAVQGVGPATAEYIRCIGMCFSRIRPESDALPSYFNMRTYADHLKESMGGLSYEVLQIFCVDKSSKIFFRKNFTDGVDSKVLIDPTEISRVIVAQSPYAIVVAHNHPNAPCRPSAEDDGFTAQAQLLCSANNVRLYDHIIIGKDGAYSYYLTGRLEDMRQQYNVQNLIAQRGVK